MSDTIITVKHDLVTVLYLNRPQTLNCFNNELLETLASTLQKAGRRPLRPLRGHHRLRPGLLRRRRPGRAHGLRHPGEKRREYAGGQRGGGGAVPHEDPHHRHGQRRGDGCGLNLALACDMIFAAEKAKFINPL